MSASARLPRLALRVMAHVRRSWRAATAPVPGEADGQDLLSFAPSLIQFGALTAFAQNYVLAVMQCVGPSMLPTLGLSGDVVLMWPTASGLVKPQLGDVVICASPTDPTSTVCKRVVGLPGDVVRYRRLPGMPALPESATRSRDGHECLQQVPRGQCWLQGDNSADSCDSRYYGPVPLSLVRGIVFLKVWPFGESRWISRTQPLERRPPPPPVADDFVRAASPQGSTPALPEHEQSEWRQPPSPPPRQQHRQTSQPQTAQPPPLQSSQSTHPTPQQPRDTGPGGASSVLSPSPPHALTNEREPAAPAVADTPQQQPRRPRPEEADAVAAAYRVTILRDRGSEEV